MSKHIHNGPNGLRLWLEDGGKLVGLEWHCPPGQCREFQNGPCPHVVLPKKGGGPLICNNTERAREAMRSWAIGEFYKFAKLFEERV